MTDYSTTAAAPVPAHVPADRVHDFDVYAPAGFERDYHLAFAALNDAGVPDVFWTPRNGGHWVVKGRDALAEAFKESTRFSSKQTTVPRDPGEGTFAPPITVDPPDHAAYRNIIAPAFTPKAVAGREAEVRALAISLIEGFKPTGRCEFVSDFAKHLPMKVFMGMVDLPEADREPLMALAEEVIVPGKRSKLEVFTDLQRYAAGKVAERKAIADGTDLISHITRAQVQGRPITDAEARSMIAMLLVGGLDTVASMLGFVAHFMATHPAHRHQLIEQPDLIGPASEELLRRFALTNPGRLAAQDTQLDGAVIKAGEMLILATPGGALDPKAYDHALEVDFNRQVNAHTTFGNGAHRCPGAILARVEVRVVLQEWLARIPEFRLDGNDAPRLRGGVNGSFVHLPLVWDV